MTERFFETQELVRKGTQRRNHKRVANISLSLSEDISPDPINTLYDMKELAQMSRDASNLIGQKRRKKQISHKLPKKQAF